MKQIFLTALLVTFCGVSTFAQQAANGSQTNGTSIAFASTTINGRMAEILEKSGNPAQGQIDVEKLKQNLDASIKEVAAMQPSSKQVLLTSANENMAAIAQIISSGAWGQEQIAGFYANVKAQN